MGEELEYFVDGFRSWRLPIWHSEENEDGETSLDFYALDLKQYLFLKLDELVGKITDSKYINNIMTVEAHHILELTLDQESSKELKDILEGR